MSDKARIVALMRSAMQIDAVDRGFLLRDINRAIDNGEVGAAAATLTLGIADCIDQARRENAEPPSNVNDEELAIFVAVIEALIRRIATLGTPDGRRRARWTGHKK